MRTAYIFESTTRLIKRLTLLASMTLAGCELVAEVSDYERQILATVLVLEAANQGETGMLAVLHVINNRAKGNPERAIGQVARRKAFSCLNAVTAQKHRDYGPVIGRAMRDRTWAKACRMIDAYVAGQLGPDFTGGATHYCIHPPESWKAEMVFTVKIGLHNFFREG